MGHGLSALGLSTILATAVATLVAAVCPAAVQAAEMQVTVTVDLNDLPPGYGTSTGFLMGWGTPHIFFSEVKPVAGDTVVVNLNFVDSTTNSPQRLEVADLGTGEGQGILAGLQGDVSLHANTSNYFTFNDVLGDVLTSPLYGSSTNGGGGVGSTIFTKLSSQPLTYTSFSFTGITWRIEFPQLTYESGDGFNNTHFTLWADKISIVPVPETLLSNLLAAVTGVGPGKALANKVKLAQTYYAAGDIPATCAVLTDFVSTVQSYAAGKKPKLSPEVASQLITDAQPIMTAIGCN